MSSINSPIDITLKPVCSDDHISRLRTTVYIGNAHYDADEIFDSLPISLASCKCADYTDGKIKACDSRGAVPIEAEKTVGIFGPQISYKFGREVNGTLKVIYELDTERHDPYARNPGFSIAEHDRGVTVAGVTFLLIPCDKPYEYRVSYDLSDLPADASSFAGDRSGNFDLTGPSELIKFRYYAIGQLIDFHRKGSKLHIITLDDDDRFFAELADTASVYFDYMESFFHDDDEDYSFILYPTRRTELTGTALTRCCYLGIGNDRISDVSEIENVLAHELTHNWCSVQDEEYLSSLFAEATAEYYSCYMQYHTGQTDLDGYVREINAKLQGYYANPWRDHAYKEVYDKSWTHAYAQKIPYIKGILMLLKMDSAVKRATDNTKSLDDLILANIDASKSGDVWDLERFIRETDNLTCGEGSRILTDVLGEGLMTPPEGFFGDGYELTLGTIPEFNEGYDKTVRFTDNVIHGLVPGSNAEKAGLKNGDRIIRTSTDSTEPLPLQITVNRDGQELSFEYLARGENVSCWQYTKKTDNK